MFFVLVCFSPHCHDWRVPNHQGVQHHAPHQCLPWLEGTVQSSTRDRTICNNHGTVRAWTVRPLPSLNLFESLWYEIDPRGLHFKLVFKLWTAFRYSPGSERMKVVLINLPKDTKLLDSRGGGSGIFGQQLMCCELFEHVRHESEQKWTFTEWLPEARSVFLIGDFNNWETRKIEMTAPSLTQKSETGHQTSQFRNCPLHNASKCRSRRKADVFLVRVSL